MTIQDASNLIEKLILETENASDRKIYLKFLNVLSELKQKQLTEKEKKMIEDTLDEFIPELNSVEKKNYNQKVFRKFIYFLIRKLTIVPKKYYSEMSLAWGVALGVSLGVSFGIPFGLPNGIIYGIIVGTIIGLVTGLFVGKYMDDQAENQNRVLNM